MLTSNNPLGVLLLNLGMRRASRGQRLPNNPLDLLKDVRIKTLDREPRNKADK